MEDEMDTTKVSMVRSAKGNDMLCVDRYLYHYVDCGLGLYRWVCNRRKDKSCKSRIATSLINRDETKHKIEKVSGEHSHSRCNDHEIFKVVERKRLADLNGEPCTLENKTVKRKMKIIRDYEAARKRRKFKVLMEDSDEDNDESQETAYNEDEHEAEDSDFWPLSEENWAQKKMRKERGTVLDPQTLYMLKTSMGRRMVSFQGYLFRLEGRSQSRTTYRWECIKRQDIVCKAHIITQVAIDGVHTVKRQDEHEHEPYTNAMLTKMLKKHDITTIAEYVQEDEHDSNAFEDSTQCSTPFEEFLMETPAANRPPKKRFNLSAVALNESRRFLSKSVAEKAPAKKKATTSPKPSLTPYEYKLVDDPLEALSENSKTTLKQKNFTFLPSAKGNKVLCLDNFIYHFDSQSPSNGRSYWTCLLRRDKFFKCNGRVTTEVGHNGPIIVKVSGTHAHPDSSADIRRRLMKNTETDSANTSASAGRQKIKVRNFKDIIAKSEDVIERRAAQLERKFKGNTEQNENVTYEIEEANDSNWSLSSALESDGEHLDDTSNLPIKIEEMLQPVKTAKNELIIEAEEHMEEELEMMTVEKEEEISFDPDNIVEEVMEEEYLESANIYENEEDETVDKQDVSSDTLFCPNDIKPIYRCHPQYRDDDDQEPDMDVTKLSTLRSAKGGELLCVDGYIYHWKSGHNLRTYWTCIKCKDRVYNCKARVSTIMTNDGMRVYKVFNHHTHPVNEADIKRRLYNEYTKGKGGMNLNIKPKDVLLKSLDELSEEYAEIVANARRSQGLRLQRMSRQGVVSTSFSEKEESTNMKLYAVSDGPPSMACRMTFEALHLPYELVNVDYCASEHMTEQYAKMNPQKEIPVLDDDGFYLSESVAIMQYLCDRYASNTKFYPKDATQRAIINHRLCFNMGFYYAAISAHTMAPIFFDYKRTDMSLKKVNNALQVFETYLQRGGTKYAAGHEVTIADFALVSATLCLEAIGFDLSPYTLVKTWYETFKKEQPRLWAVAEGGMQEIMEFEKNPPDLSHMNHPFHPTRKL